MNLNVSSTIQNNPNFYSGRKIRGRRDPNPPLRTGIRQDPTAWVSFWLDSPQLSYFHSGYVGGPLIPLDSSNRVTPKDADLSHFLFLPPSPSSRVRLQGKLQIAWLLPQGWDVMSAVWVGSEEPDTLSHITLSTGGGAEAFAAPRLRAVD